MLDLVSDLTDYSFAGFHFKKDVSGVNNSVFPDRLIDALINVKKC